MVEVRSISGPPESRGEAQGALPRSDIIKAERTQTKHKKRVRRLRGALLMAGVTAIATLPQLDNTERVIRAEFGQSVSCVGSTHAATPGYEADVIAVPTATSVRGKDGKLVPNHKEAIRLDAAFAVYDAGIAPHIVLLGSPSRIDPQEHEAAEIDFLQQKVKAVGGPPLEDDVVYPEIASRSTLENMQALRRIMHEHGWAKAAIVTNEYHENRAVVDACKEGIAAYPIAAEPILLKEGLTQQVSDVRKSITQRDKIKEKIGTLSALVPSLK